MRIHLVARTVALALGTVLGCWQSACSAPEPAAASHPAVQDTAGADTAALDALSDASKPGDADPGADAAAAQCCQKAGAQCGFVSGCVKACGTCKSDATCTKNKCVQKPVLKKLGESCGPNKDCRPPANGAAQLELDDYFACLNSQCETDNCYLGTCTDTCTPAKDQVVNATGAVGQDGIEDPGEKSECAGAATGPGAVTMHCVEQASAKDAAAGKTSALCMVGTTFAACKATSDCPAGEACAIRYILGGYTTVCIPNPKNPSGKPAATYSQFCNGDPIKAEVQQCDNGHCSTAGTCLAFCKSDSDCITAPGACQAGVCKGSSLSCKGDVDCSAAVCVADQKFYSNVSKTFSLCRARPCALDGECRDQAFYCRNWYNGVKNIEGDPDPADPTKVTMAGWAPACVRKQPGAAKKGQDCDPYTSDNDTSLPVCENPSWCYNGKCGGLCKEDTDCASGQKCGVSESSFDLSSPADGVSDVFLPIAGCQPMPGAKSSCRTHKDCSDPGATYCRPWEYALPLSQDSSASNLATGGVCIAPEPGYAEDGAACGLQAGAQLCKSGICLGTNSGTTAGYCGKLCASNADCPANLMWQGGTYKSVCRSYFRAWSGTADPADDLYLPLCGTAPKDSSLADCAATKKCSNPKEYCAAFGVAFGPDQPVKMSFACLTAWTSKETPGTKQAGQACNLKPAANSPPECASGYACRPDAAPGQGYCIAPCNTDADCGLAAGATPTDGLICDTSHMFIARSDPAKAGYAPFCMKKKACLPCKWDSDCTGNYRCTNLGGSYDAADGRCAAPCAADGDCAGQGGGKCGAPVGRDGKPVGGAKVCQPTCVK